MIDLNKIYKTNSYGDLKVVNYINKKEVEVEFVNTGCRMITSTYQIVRGQVKDKLHPTVKGVGFIGVGNYKPTVNKSKAYQCWVGMLERCYCDKYQAKQPTYIGCTVTSEWHNFQVFAKWFECNYIKGFHLDKDIKIKGNKIYSPETCLFVSQNDNNVAARARRYNVKSPQGEFIDVFNLAEFCRTNNLSQSMMSLVCSGKLDQHKGWIKA